MIWKSIFFAITAVGTLRADSSNYLKQICKENGAEDKIEEAEKLLSNFSSCVHTVFDLKAAWMEFIEATVNGSVRSVLQKYCPRSPQLKTCFREYFGVTPCLDLSLLAVNISVINEINDEGIDLICYDNGSRIAAFIEDRGFQCIEENGIALKKCFEKPEESIWTIFSSSRARFLQHGGCRLLEEFQDCTVTILEGCPTMAAANMTESVFKYIRRTAFCKV